MRMKGDKWMQYTLTLFRLLTHFQKFHHLQHEEEWTGQKHCRWAENWSAPTKAQMVKSMALHPVSGWK